MLFRSHLQNPAQHLSLKLFLTLCLLSTSSFYAQAQQCPTLTWSDEFEGSTLDLTKWEYQLGDGCDLGICGWGNNEEQYYQSNNATVSGGMLTIAAKREQAGGKQYTSARIRTINKGDFNFGRFEARIKMTAGQGLWPAFWMLPTDEVFGGWPQSGEIDIMENVGNEPSTIHGTIHYGNPWPNNQFSGQSYELGSDAFSDEFYEFAVEREAGEIRWFVNDNLYFTRKPEDIAPINWPFDERFHFVLNVAVGGNWPGSPDNTTVFPQTLDVDYIRVYDGNFPHITGDRSVNYRGAGVTYSVGNAFSGSTFAWAVPEGATIVSGQGTDTITVDWGESGGDVVAEISSSCGTDQLAMEVAMGSPFSFGFSFENFDEPGSVNTGTVSGTLTEVSNPDPSGVNTSALSGRYARDAGELFDVLFYNTTSITDATMYVDGENRFFMDVYTSAPIGTEILIQLEDGRSATPGNFPVGRHSRYQAFTTAQNEWTRLGFDYIDSPDPSTAAGGINTIVLLFAPNSNTSDVFYFDNFDSYEIGAAPEPTHTEDASEIPDQFTLHQNYPNPFNPTTTISFSLPTQSHVALKVYNVLGREVVSLADRFFDAGQYNVAFDARNLSAGIYLYTIQTELGTITRRMTLLK